MTDKLEKARQVFGFDTNRIYANQAQVVVNDNDGTSVVIVFREQANLVMADESPPDNKVFLSKNVASLVLPAEVAKQLGAILIAKTAEMEQKTTNTPTHGE